MPARRPLPSVLEQPHNRRIISPPNAVKNNNNNKPKHKMSENVNVLDLLNQNLSADDLEPSLFIDGAQVLFEIKKAETVVKTDPATGATRTAIVFDLATMNPEDSNKGTKLPAGYPFTYRINLQTTSKAGNDIAHLVKRNLAEFRKAATGEFGAFGDPTQYVGRRLLAVMEVEQTPQYGKQNRIGKIVPLAQ